MKCHPANLFFYERLVELRHEAASKGRLRQERSYSRALQSLRRYPLPLNSTHDAAGLQGVGRIVSSFLEEGLQSRSALVQEVQDTESQKELWLSLCRRRLLAALKRGPTQSSVTGRQNARQAFLRARNKCLASGTEESCKPEKRCKGVSELRPVGHIKCGVVDCLIPLSQMPRQLARTISEPLPLPTETSALTAKSVSRQRLSDSAQLVLLIDHREVGAGRQHSERGALVAELSSKLGVNSVQARALPVGDMMWVWQDVAGEELVAGWLIERKTFHDLSASITDGRYDEQKSRLLDAPGLDGVIYLVEGSMALFGVGESSKGGSEASGSGHKGFGQRLVSPSLPAATLSTTAVHTQLISGFHVIHSASTPHTVSQLVALHGALLEHRQLRIAAAEIPCLVPYEGFAELTRKSCQSRLFEAFGRMLRMVPSCGPEATEALIDEFQTPHCLSQALINSSDAELLLRLRARRGNTGRLPVTASTLAMCRSLFTP